MCHRTSRPQALNPTARDPKPECTGPQTLKTVCLLLGHLDAHGVLEEAGGRVLGRHAGGVGGGGRGPAGWRGGAAGGGGSRRGGVVPAADRVAWRAVRGAVAALGAVAM